MGRKSFTYGQRGKKSTRLNAPLRTTVFRKGDYRLVVHQYGASLCGVLKLAQVKPRVAGVATSVRPAVVAERIDAPIPLQHPLAVYEHLLALCRASAEIAP